jgi:DNA invertase Pin-like site-specific DNA recombinase
VKVKIIHHEKGEDFMYGNYSQLERYKSNKVIRVGGYIRCSGDEQKKNGYTIQDQTSLIDDFCREMGLAMVERYADEGVSATLEISKRKELARLIEDAKQGKFDIVVFKCIDRYSRNVGEYYVAQRQLEKAGVTWLSIEESDLDPADPDAGFKINIYLTMAEYEAKKTSKRIKFNNKNRVKNRQVTMGSHCFHFPWHVVGEPKNKHLERNEEKAHILYDLLDYYETHQSKASTVGYINRKYSMSLTTRTLSNILKNTLLYGEYKGVTDYVKPYISIDRFNKIQEISKRNVRQTYAPTHIFLFSSMVRCYHCGRIMIGNTNKSPNGTTNFRYRCNHYRYNKVCINKNALGEKKLEKQLLDNLELYVARSMVKVSSIKDDVPDNNTAMKVAELKEEMDRLNIMFRKKRISEEEYDTDYYELERKLEALNVDSKEPREIDVDGLKELLESNYREIYASLDKEHKRAFWHGIIKEFTVGEDRKIIPESIEFF